MFTPVQCSFKELKLISIFLTYELDLNFFIVFFVFVKFVTYVTGNDESWPGLVGLFNAFHYGFLLSPLILINDSFYYTFQAMLHL